MLRVSSLSSPARRSSLASIALVAALAAAAGCGQTFERSVNVTGTDTDRNGSTVEPVTGPPPEGAVAIESADGAATWEFAAATTPTALDVGLNLGSLTVRADPKYSTIRVRATVTVSDDVPEEERAELAERVSAWAHLEESPEARRATLRVRAESPSPEATDHRIDLVITMPRCDGVLVHNRGGHVELVGVAGAIQVENAGGAIEVRTPHPITDPVALITDTGNIYFQVPPGSSGSFDLSSRDGMVTMASIVAPREVYSLKNVYRGVILDDANPVVMRSDTGDVRAWVRKDPTALVRWVK